MSAILPGANKLNPKDGLTYVWVPPGSFLMGCSPNDMMCASDEKPPHPVTITKGFWMGQTPVTNMAWIRTGHPADWGERQIAHAGKTFKLSQTTTQENAPAVGMLWDEARVFCQKVGGRLPTEAEWEYAARAGTTSMRYARPAAISISTGENGRERSLPGPARVAQKEKNCGTCMTCMATSCSGPMIASAQPIMSSAWRRIPQVHQRVRRGSYGAAPLSATPSCASARRPA